MKFFCVLLIVLSHNTLSFAGDLKKASEKTQARPPVENECTAGKAEAAFSASINGIKNYKATADAKNNLLKEVFDFVDLKQIEVRQGGCAHFWYGIRFPVDVAAPAKSSAKALIEMAESLLKKMATGNDLISRFNRQLAEMRSKLLKAQVMGIEDQKKTLIEATDEDGFATFSVELIENAKAVQLQVGISITL